MKVFVCIFLALLVTVPIYSAAQENPATQSDSATVAQLVYDYLNALKTKDVVALERIMADDFIITNVDGSVNSKEQEIAPFREKDLQFDSASLQDVSIKLYGTAAIVRGAGTFVGKAKWGAFSSRERFTDVYLKRDGKWQVVASHSSSMRKK